MTGVRQAKSDLTPSERPHGVLLEFPAGRFEHALSPAPEAAEAPTPSLLTLAPQTPIEFRLSASEPAAAPIFAPSAASTTVSPVATIQSSIPSPGSPTSPPAQLRQIQSTVVGAQCPPANVEPPPRRKNWFQRWLNPDRSDQDKRQAARNQTPNLIAHFWTGGAPQAHPVRDISASGLYVITTERWYLGTQIRVTLTRTGKGDPQAARTLTVHAIVKRWGDDGVGLAFVPDDSRNPPQDRHSPINGANTVQLQQFVNYLQLASPTGTP
jgi:hypothetical protein